MFESPSDSPHVLTADDIAQLGRSVAPSHQEFIDLKKHSPRYHDYPLAKDNTSCLRKSLPDQSIQFDKGLLRAGTILRYKGFIITSKGKKVDTALLNPDSLKDRFQLEQLKLREQRQKLLESMPVLRPDLAFDKLVERRDTSVKFVKQTPRDPGEFAEGPTQATSGKIPAYLHLRAQRNSLSVLTDQALRSNNYSEVPHTHGEELGKGYLSSFRRTQAASSVSQENSARAKKCIQWQQRMHL